MQRKRREWQGNEWLFTDDMVMTSGGWVLEQNAVLAAASDADSHGWPYVRWAGYTWTPLTDTDGARVWELAVELIVEADL